MTNITKKLKISLTAIAFILGIGAAFATNANSSDPCPQDVSEICEPGTDPCCIVPQNETRDFDGQHYTAGETVRGELN